MKLNLDLCLLKKNEIYSRDYQKKINEIHKNIFSDNHSAGTTWVDWPENYDKKEFTKILKLAREIQKNSDVLLVVGIGGSYLGSKAGLEMMTSKTNTEVLFAGTSFDYTELNQTLEYIKNKDVTVNIISKSGVTTEILACLNIVEKFMKNKYKNNYKERMIFTTDKSNGYLRKLAASSGIEALTIPDFMGGRYSVLSAVGLLPFAVAGLNIKRILDGAYDAYKEFNTEKIENNLAYQYAIYRHLLAKKLNKKIELFASFNSKLKSFGYFLQQLFLESEGKDGKGLFVCPLSYSTDLHSVGQYIQQGSPIVSETIISVNKQLKDAALSNIPLDSPIKYLDGVFMSEINSAAQKGTIDAHANAGVPIAIIEIDETDEYNYGYLVYFFELSCAASGYLLGINPFNQPGVEQYKRCMKNYLINKN